MSRIRRIRRKALQSAPKKAAPKPALKKIVEAVKEVLAPDDEPAKEEE